jgi:hypothetical protein
MSDSFALDFSALVRYAKDQLDEHARSDCPDCARAPEFVKRTWEALDAARDESLAHGGPALAAFLLFVRVALAEMGPPESDRLFRAVLSYQGVRGLIEEFRREQSEAAETRRN